jgi:hypothetical protein
LIEPERIDDQANQKHRDDRHPARDGIAAFGWRGRISDRRDADHGVGNRNDFRDGGNIARRGRSDNVYLRLFDPFHRDRRSDGECDGNGDDQRHAQFTHWTVEMDAVGRRARFVSMAKQCLAFPDINEWERKFLDSLIRGNEMMGGGDRS